MLIAMYIHVSSLVYTLSLQKFNYWKCNLGRLFEITYKDVGILYIYLLLMWTLYCKSRLFIQISFILTTSIMRNLFRYLLIISIYSVLYNHEA